MDVLLSVNDLDYRIEWGLITFHVAYPLNALRRLLQIFIDYGCCWLLDLWLLLILKWLNNDCCELQRSVILTIATQVYCVTV